MSWRESRGSKSQSYKHTSQSVSSVSCLVTCWGLIIEISDYCLLGGCLGHIFTVWLFGQFVFIWCVCLLFDCFIGLFTVYHVITLLLSYCGWKYMSYNPYILWIIWQVWCGEEPVSRGTTEGEEPAGETGPRERYANCRGVYNQTAATGETKDRRVCVALSRILKQDA